MNKLKELVDSYIQENKNNPSDRITIKEDVLLESLKDELPFLHPLFKKTITVEVLRDSIEKYNDTNLDADSELQDIYDASFACIYTITKAIWAENPEDEDEDVDFFSCVAFDDDGKVSFLIKRC